MSVFKSSGVKNYRIQFRIDGRTYVKSAKTSDKRIAERMEVEWRAQIHARKYFKELEPITLNQMFEQYLLQPHSETTKKNAQTFRTSATAYVCDENAEGGTDSE